MGGYLTKRSRASGPRRATEHDASIGMEREAARRVDAVAPRLHQMSQGLHLLSHPASHQRSLRTSVTPILQIRKLRLREEHCLSVTQYEAGSEEAVPGPSVFPSGEPGVSGDFWGSQEGCQGEHQRIDAFEL